MQLQKIGRMLASETTQPRSRYEVLLISRFPYGLITDEEGVGLGRSRETAWTDHGEESMVQQMCVS
jgi:hypothetical protein